MTAGGGLASGKLELANAQPGDVVSGKKFYAGDKEIKTGTLKEMGGWTSAVSLYRSNASTLGAYIPAGAYRKTGNGGYPVINFSEEDVRKLATLRHVTFDASYTFGSSDSTISVNLASKLSKDVYSKLTVDNIIGEAKEWRVKWGSAGPAGGHNTKLNKSYNQNTGVLTFEAWGGVYDIDYGAYSATVHVFY